MSSTIPFAINCPYKEKDQAKELGARWNKDNKVWYAPSQQVYDLLSKWHYKKNDDDDIDDCLEDDVVYR